ncbi:MAG TPA: CvpA family protein [Pirellulales bacterium]
MEVHSYDVFMLVVLLTATLFGAWSGLAWQLAALASCAASWAVAMSTAKDLAPYLASDPVEGKFLAMLIVFLSCTGILFALLKSISSTVERVKLQEFDPQAGALFGLMKGLLYCLVVTFFATTMNATARNQILHTRSGYYAATVMHGMKAIAPPELDALLASHLARYNRMRELDANGLVWLEPPAGAIAATPRFAPTSFSPLQQAQAAETKFHEQAQQFQHDAARLNAAANRTAEQVFPHSSGNGLLR